MMRLQQLHSMCTVVDRLNNYFKAVLFVTIVFIAFAIAIWLQIILFSKKLPQLVLFVFVG